MDEVVPHLWVGELPSCLSPEYLEAANVHHVVSCMRTPPRVPSGIPVQSGNGGHAETRQIKDEDQFVVHVDDDDEAPLFVYFGLCNRFISGRLQEEWLPDDGDAHDAEDPAIEGLTMRNGERGLWHAKSDTSVLVHCHAGRSRSVTITAAYLMWSRHISREQALAVIRQQRPAAEPNDGFLRQLALYEQERFRVSLQSHAVRRFLLSRTYALDGYVRPDMLFSAFPHAAPADPFSDPQTGAGFAEAERPSYRSNSCDGARNAMRESSSARADGTRRERDDAPDGTQQEGGDFLDGTQQEGGDLPDGTQQDDDDSPDGTQPPRQLQLCCKMCRYELATSEHVVVHAPGKGELGFEPHKRDNVQKGLNTVRPARASGDMADASAGRRVLPANLARIHAAAEAARSAPLLQSSVCSAFFVEPLQWMSDSSNVVPGVVHGRILCPNTRCNAKLGSWTWAGSQCACGAWVTPAFALQKAKVDERGGG
ncbi:hypothetical protein MSPP1_002918 [Malassezia sp. CBS 17886]|nr:hypothetical protein MSPP1_002918 [Malassezia sp. CBS 17886]